MRSKINLLAAMLFAALLFSNNLFAQYCGNSGSTICTPGGPYSQLGFYPGYDSTPCVKVGVLYNHTLDMQIPATVNYLGAPRTLNYVKVNSITNLPCGLCWSTDVPNNQFSGNSTHCVHITGTSYDAPGQYKLVINIDAQASIGGFPFTLTNQSADSFGVKFWARVEALDGTCAAVDTLGPSKTAHTSGSATTPTIAGASSFCAGSSTALTLSNAASFYAYKWSTGATSSSINVSAAGTYTVTAYAACTSVTASKTVTVTTPSVTVAANGPTTFCSGGSVTLNAGSGYSAYAWSNGAGSGQTANITQSGSYVVTVTQNGCTVSSSATVVTVNNNPTPTITAGGPTTFCSGGSVTLDAGAGYDTYAWNNAGGSNQTVSATASGSYIVTVTQDGCTGTASAVPVTVTSVTPSVTASGPTTFCSGGSVTLDAGAGYDTYAWSNGGGSNQTVTATASGVYVVTVTQNGCSGTTSAVTVSVASSLAPVISASNGLQVCTGATTTLDAGTGYDTYTWSNTGSNQTTDITASGTYTVTVTLGACNGTASETVTVGNFPVTLNLVNPPAGCVGDVITLDAGSGHAQYAWSNTATTQTTDVSASGAYTVTVTEANACTGTATLNVTLNALPVPTPTPAGTQAICAGGSLTLDAGAGYSTYAWSNGDNTQTTSVSSADSYSVTVTQNGCQGASAAPIVVTVTQLPSTSITPAGVQNICSGQSITLDAGAGFVSYLWSNGATTQTITVDSTGTYNVSVSQNNCDGSSTGPTTVFANITPNAAVSELGTANGFTVLEASPANGSYEWFSATSPNGAYTSTGISTNTDTVVCGDVATFYAVAVTQNGCSDTSALQTVACVGISKVPALASFTVQPNPAADVLVVKYELNNPTFLQLSVFDLTGRKVMNALSENVNKGTHLQELHIADLAPGIYMLNFNTNVGQFNTKFVKQ